MGLLTRRIELLLERDPSQVAVHIAGRLFDRDPAASE